MKQIVRLLLVTFLFVGLAIGAAGRGAADHIIKAKARISGAPGSGISGEAFFFQSGRGHLPTVQVAIVVRGLEPGSTHGVHIHENGSCADTTNPAGMVVPFGGAGGHYDPGPNTNSNPDTNHPFHMGDLPNLRANSYGVATLAHTTSRITLFPEPSPLTVFDANGSAVIVHLNPDQGITGAAGSGVSGGPRIACGIIELID